MHQNADFGVEVTREFTVSGLRIAVLIEMVLQEDVVSIGGRWEPVCQKCGRGRRSQGLTSVDELAGRIYFSFWLRCDRAF